MATKLDSSQLRVALACNAMVIAALLMGGAAIAQPIDPAASAPAVSATPSPSQGPVRRPPAAKPPPPLGTDPSTQPGLGQPVTPQVRIPLGKKAAPAIAGPGPRPTGNAASSPVTGDAAARCEAMRGEQIRLKCLDQLARESNRRK